MKHFDWTIWLGIGIGALAIFTGAWLENLSLTYLWHPTAALIVFGGTFGAVLVRRGFEGVISAFRSIWHLGFKKEDEQKHQIELARLAWLARSANKNGVKVYESQAETSNDTLVAQGLTLAAELAPPEKIKQILARTLELEDENGLQDASTLEAAAGFAPTFGILGAVIGLIGVLRVLDKPDSLGLGIATAFVATIYGIGLANLILFPIAARLRLKHAEIMKRREEIADVLLALAARETPRAIISRFNLQK